MIRTLVLAAISLASFGILLAPALAADESEMDLKKMAGEWVPISMQLNGKKQPEAVMKAIKLTIKGAKYNTVVGKEKDEGTLKLDTSKDPREMDIVPSVGENKGKLLPCIYEIEGNELRVCYAFNGTPRPSDFKSAEDEKGVIMLITYKRVSKGGKR